ncbi:MAG: hypothetical protein RLZZ123_1824 [Pseudomonadota bacterium]
MRMNFNTLFAATGLLLALTGCGAVVQQVQQDIDHTVPTELTPKGLSKSADITAKPEDIEAAAEAQKTKPVLRRASKPWFGSSVTALPNQNLPSSLTQHQFMDYGAEPVLPELVFVRLSQLTGLPFRYESPTKEKKVEVKAVQASELDDKNLGSKDKAESAQVAEWARARAKSAGNSPLQMPVEVPTGDARSTKQAAGASKGAPITTENSNGLLMVWSGSIASYLDWACGQLGLTWSYDGGTVLVSRLKTVTYQLMAASGKQTIRSSTSGTSNLDTGGGGSGNSGAAGTLTTTNTAEADQFEATIKAIDALSKTEGSHMSVNHAVGTVTVTTTGAQHVQIRKFIEGENQLASKRFNVTIDLYTVSTTDAENFGFNPASLIAIHGKSNIGYTGVAGLGNQSGSYGSAGVLKFNRPIYDNNGNPLSPQSLVLQSLRETGYAVEHLPLSLITQNAVWDTKMRAITSGYISEVSSNVSATTPPVVTRTTRIATLITGDTFAAQPTLMPDGSVRLNYAITLKTLQGIKSINTDSSSSAVQVQIPEVSSIVTNSVVKLVPGENLLLTGLSRRVLTSSNSRLAPDAPIALGGADAGKVSVEHLVILIRVVQI